MKHVNLNIYFVVFLCAMLLGCSTEKLLEDAQSPEASGISYIHHIDPDDVLMIKVFGEESLSGEFKVDANGMITFPFLGDVDVLGYKADEVKDQIEIGLANGYLVSPNVSVEVLYKKPIYVLGEVNKPGSFPFSPDINILKAVALAEGFTHRANKESFKMIRGNGDKEETFSASSQTSIHPGDVIIVKERFF